MWFQSVEELVPRCAALKALFMARCRGAGKRNGEHQGAAGRLRLLMIREWPPCSVWWRGAEALQCA